MAICLVINGPNLNMLEKRDKTVYGGHGLPQIQAALSKEAEAHAIGIDFMQSNHEGEIIDALHAAYGKYEFIVMNPGAYSHTSIAIRDAVECCRVPVIEVHISNISAREEFRRHSCTAPVCAGVIYGFGWQGYLLALDAGCRMFKCDDGGSNV